MGRAFDLEALGKSLESRRERALELSLPAGGPALGLPRFAASLPGLAAGAAAGGELLPGKGLGD